MRRPVSGDGRATSLLAIGGVFNSVISLHITKPERRHMSALLGSGRMDAPEAQAIHRRACMSDCNRGTRLASGQGTTFRTCVLNTFLICISEHARGGKEGVIAGLCRVAP